MPPSSCWADFDEIPGLAFAGAGQAPLYVSTVARLLLGLLIVAAGVSSTRRIGSALPWVALLMPAAFVLAMIGLTHALQSGLAPLSDFVLVVDLDGRLPAAPVLPSSSPVGTMLQLAGAVIFGAGMLVTRRLYRRDAALGDAYLAVGLVFMIASQINLAFYPGTFPGLVTSGDGLRAAFDVVLLLGIQAEARRTLSDLRRANTTLEGLREVEADRAALEERARVSRELHDGLAQDLWLAKLKVGRLSTMSLEPPEARVLAGELGGVIDAGLADARQAVMALRIERQSPDGSLQDLLRRYIDDFAERFGLHVEFEADDQLPHLAHRTEVEVLRIAQEALANVRRHADATLVRVSLHAFDGQVALTVRDNGMGFDPSTVSDSGFGLASMRERAAIALGRLAITSRPGDGTTVTLSVAAAPADGATSIASSAAGG